MSRLNTMQTSLVFVCLAPDDVDHCFTCCSRHGRGHYFKVESKRVTRYHDFLFCEILMVLGVPGMVPAGVWSGGKFEC